MEASKRIANFGVPWEAGYGYCQAVRVKDVVYVSGQLSHDSDGTLVAPAELDAARRPSNFMNMEPQMRQTYANAAALLAQLGATLDDVVEETLFVLDVDAAFAVAGKVRKDFYKTDLPQCASNPIGVSRLAFPEQLIEITFRAVLTSP